MENSCYLFLFKNESKKKWNLIIKEPKKECCQKIENFA